MSWLDNWSPLRRRRNRGLRPRDLLVVVPLNNSNHYRSRIRLLDRFKLRMRRAGVELLTVELTYGENPAQGRGGYGDHLQFRLPGQDEFWHKENLLNLGIRHAAHAFRYVAVVDPDVRFQNDEWAMDTLRQLQRFDVVQMFEHAIDLDPDSNALFGDARNPTRLGFAASMWAGRRPSTPRYDGPDFHPGYAWAWRREAVEGMDGLIDFAILGSGDRHMAMGLYGLAEKSMPGGIHPTYRDKVLDWQARAAEVIRQNVGFVPGLITHEWHGKKADRRYADRWKILVEHRFNPAVDVVHDHRRGGLLRWAGQMDQRQQRLRDDVRRYFKARNEDSVDVA